MLYEPTTLASTTGVLATALEQEYGIDPEPVFARAGFAMPPYDSPQLRFPLSKTRELWAVAKEATGEG